MYNIAAGFDIENPYNLKCYCRFVQNSSRLTLENPYDTYLKVLLQVCTVQQPATGSFKCSCSYCVQYSSRLTQENPYDPNFKCCCRFVQYNSRLISVVLAIVVYNSSRC